MAEQTKNFGFTKPDANEFYNIEVQNENWEKLDSAFTCGTEDLVAGESELPTGTFYFVYE